MNQQTPDSNDAPSPPQQQESRDWAEDQDSRSRLLYDSFRQLVTITTALLAAFAASEKTVLAHLGFKIVTVLLLLCCLGVAFYGSMPRERTLPLRTRCQCLYVSTGCLVLAFAVLYVGMTVQALP